MGSNDDIDDDLTDELDGLEPDSPVLESHGPEQHALENSVQRRAVVPAECHGARVDQVAVKLFPGFSRARLQGWINGGQLTLDGETVRQRAKVAVEQVLELNAELQPEVSWVGEERELDIVYEDEHVLVLNKSAGWVVHPAAGHASGTLVNALLGYAPELERLPRGGIVHRLDKDTSGIMVVARSVLAHQSLVAQLADRRVSREYAAVCVGALSGGGTIDAPMARHPGARTKMAVVPNGKRAITHYRIAERFGSHTALKVNLETGRTHQIRVHMAHRKNPLIGDPTYGGRPRIPAGASKELIDALRAFPRQALHARRLEFDHPKTGEIVGFETPLPSDFLALLDVLRHEDPVL